MKKFEYKTESYVIKDDILFVLNSLGKKGWECFEIKKDYDDCYGTSYSLFLKREIEQTSIEQQDEAIINSDFYNTTNAVSSVDITKTNLGDK